MTYLFSIPPLDNSRNIGLFILSVMLISWLLSRVVRFVLILYLKKAKGAPYTRTSAHFLKNSVKFIITVMALVCIILVVPVFRNKATLIFSGAGILAAIVGFAAQAAISNLIAGAFIVLFKPFRVGDYIRLDQERAGIVEDINLRHTIINNFENKRLIIPNSIISTESVLNHSIEDSHILSFNNFYLGMYADIDRARAIIIEEAEKIEHIIENRRPNHIFDKNEKLVVRTVGIKNNIVHIRAYTWISNPSLEFKVKAILREAVHKRFVKERIDFPLNMNLIIPASDHSSHSKKVNS